MRTFEIWRFEKQLIAACNEILKEALRLVGCDLSPKVFLVGFSPQTGFATVIPDNHDIDTNELEACLQSITEAVVPFPDDPDLPDADWSAAFQSHDRFLWQC